MHENFMNEVSYSYTNENLESILLGLKPCKEDNILSIGGSGAQAFMMIAEGAKVTCVDKDPIQIKYINLRNQQLRDGSMVPFTGGSLEVYSYIGDSYFTKSKVKKLKRNIDNLKILEGDIFELAMRKPGFNKMYFSNAINYQTKMNFDTFKDIMKQIAKNLPLDGLIYISNHDNLRRDYMLELPTYRVISNDRLIHSIPNPEGLLPEGLIIDEERSTIARRKEISSWNPAVYRKIK